MMGGAKTGRWKVVSEDKWIVDRVGDRWRISVHPFMGRIEETWFDSLLDAAGYLELVAMSKDKKSNEYLDSLGE